MEFVRKVLNEYLSIYLESNSYCRSVEILNKFFKIDLIVRFDGVELNKYVNKQNQSKQINLLHRNFFKKKEQKDYLTNIKHTELNSSEL